MLNANGKNLVKKGEVIFSQGEIRKQVGIVLSGKVLMETDCTKLVRGQGSYIALNAMNEEHYGATYTALEDSVVFALPVSGEDSMQNIISRSTDYRAIMISSQYKYAVDMSRLRNNLVSRLSRLYNFAKDSYDKYMDICQKMNLQAITIDELDMLEMYEGLDDIYEDKIAYYAEGAKIPLNAQKLYFSYSEEMAMYQVNEIISVVSSYKEDCISMTEYIRNLLDVVGLRPRQNLYELLCAKGQEMRKNGDIPLEMHILLTTILEEIKFQYAELKKQVEGMVELNEDDLKKKMVELSALGIAKDDEKSREEKEAEIQRNVMSLKNSMDQIIRYSEISEENQNKLVENVNYLVAATDRLSVEDDVKKAKKAIIPIVFELYLSCYRKLRNGVIPPKAVELFLNYGFLDERLLEQEHLEFLCGIEAENNEGPCNVYTMTEWLDMIYSGQREPSKSEFDEDYVENLRSLKKQGEITEKEQKELLNNMDKRVEYEVMNMQKSNMRALYGQPSAYMPILYKEAIYGYLDKILVTKKIINESVNKLLKIDYSAFYREVIYSNNDLKIINETVMKNVYPDIILFPLFGTNASMWQEIGSKNKGTPGRFCFPIMTNTNIDDLMVKMFGRFRWELCRCIQGMAWNDVKVKSLTSEYMDYIQFYRKNRELSDEAREKVKIQIQKGRNNSREIFLMDYEIWVKNEVNGSMKMNKVARELVATYCPLEKSLRAKLGVQRPYEVAMARSIRNAVKKKQEFELKIKSIQKNTTYVPDEIMDTYKFYAEL